MASVKPKCDFCGDQLVLGHSWVFEARDFAMTKGIREQVSEGNWTACDKCKALIVDGKRDKLAKRGARTTLGIAPPGTTFPMALDATRTIQDGFWANRFGPPRLETAAEFDAPVKPPYWVAGEGAEEGGG